MNAKKHGKVTMALAMIGGLAALSIAYAAISTQLNINSGDNSEKVEASAVMFDSGTDAQGEKLCRAYGVSKAVDSSGIVSASSEYEDASDKKTDNDVAKCGSIEIGSSSKENDTVTINGTILRDYGAFAVYKLTIVNKGSTAVKLTSNPNSNAVTQFTGGTDEIKKNITIGVYSEDTCNEKVAVFSEEKAPSKSQANYILGNSSTTWYVKVAHRVHGDPATEYSAGTDPTSAGHTSDITSGSFGFTMTPVWANV